MKKLQNTTSNTISKIAAPAVAVALILLLWHWLSTSGVMPEFMMPSPGKVLKAFREDFPILCRHGATTLQEAFLGLFFGIGLSFVIATLMDACRPLMNGIYPLLIVSQTIPSIAIAPLLLLWFGYGMFPKVVLIVLTTFFPITIGLIEGFASVDRDGLNLMRAMGAGPVKRYLYIKLPSALGYFFSGLKISVTYSVVGAVISEWLGGTEGLGVYMTRVRKSFSYDRMFAVIFFIAAVSLLLMLLVTIIKWLIMPWERKNHKHA